MNNVLETVAIICLPAGGVCALVIAVDLLAGHRQQMWIMNVVWPITALYAGPLALWAYFTAGRLSPDARSRKRRSVRKIHLGKRSRSGNGRPRGDALRRRLHPG